MFSKSMSSGLACCRCCNAVGYRLDMVRCAVDTLLHLLALGCTKLTKQTLNYLHLPFVVCNSFCSQATQIVHDEAIGTCRHNKLEMQHASLWLQEGGKVKLTDSLGGTKEGLHYRKWKISLSCLSRDSTVINSKVQVICQDVNQPKVQTHSRLCCLLQCHKRLAAVLNLFLVYTVR